MKNENEVVEKNLNFEEEKQNLVKLLDEMIDGSEEGCDDVEENPLIGLRSLLIGHKTSSNEEYQKIKRATIFFHEEHKKIQELRKPSQRFQSQNNFKK